MKTNLAEEGLIDMLHARPSNLRLQCRQGEALDVRVVDPQEVTREGHLNLLHTSRPPVHPHLKPDLPQVPDIRA